MPDTLASNTHMSPNSRALLLAEMLLLFGGIPMLHYFRLMPFHFIVTMMLLSVVAIVYIVRHPQISNRVFGFNGFNHWKQLWALFAVYAVSSALFVYLTTPNQLFIMPLEHTWRWLGVMAFYPVFSGITQELLFRGYFMDRYKPLFANPWVLIVVNGVLFGLAHLMFGHWLTVGLSTIGGFIYAWVYHRYKSLLLVSLVHGLIGNWLFTVGLGQYFYLKQ